MADDRIRPKPVPQPPPGPGQLPADKLPGEGRPPLRTGEVYMSDYTKQQLKKLGWQEGDPIPGDLGTEIGRIQQKVAQERDEANWEDNPPPGYKKPQPKFVDIDDLPEEEKAKLREYLVTYKEEVEQEQQLKAARQAAEAAVPENLSPEMREASLRAAEQEAAAKLPRGGTFVDDRATASVETVSEPPKTPTAPVPEPGDTHYAAADEYHHPLFCPRCLWDQKKPFEIAPTQEDKEAFIAAILGMGRFEKKYDLMGGNVVVYFRSLTSHEVSVLNTQLSWHIRRGEIIGDGEYFMWLTEYRMILATSRIETSDKVLKPVMTLETYEKEHPDSFGPSSKNPDLPPTALLSMRDWFYKDVVSVEPVRRIIGQKHRDFQRLVEGMEALADSTDFWKGIEQPA